VAPLARYWHAGRLACSALTIAVALTAGCGGDKEAHQDRPPDERTKVRQVVHDYYAAYASGDGEAACSKLTGQLQRELVYYLKGDVKNPPTCQETVREHSTRFGPDEKARYSDLDLSPYKLTIKGRRATFREPNGTKTAVLTKDPNAGWLLSILYIDDE
jgi:hypothetical protein